jgi:hypothetical protein
MNSCFRNGNGLLLHDFVNCNAVNIRHFVELVNADYATVSQDHCASFKSPFSRLLVSRYRSRKTDARTTSTRGGNGERCRTEDESEHLRFGC